MMITPVSRPAVDAEPPVDADLVEVALRAFRRSELQNRARPTRVRIATDLVPRLTLLSGSYLVMLVAAQRMWGLVATVVFATAATSMVGSWFHEALHDNLALGPVLRPLLRRIGSAPFGLSPLWWRYKHLQLHHPHVGDAALDPDIQFGPFARVRESQARRGTHRLQHISVPLLAPVSTIAMLLPGELRGRRRPGARKARFSEHTQVRILADKYVPWLVVWTPLALVNGIRLVTLQFLVFSAVGGVLALVIIQSQHNTDVTDGPSLPGVGPLRIQLERTSDVRSPRGCWWWLSGGTTIHVTHHLAPQLSFLETAAATRRLHLALAPLGVLVPTHASMRAGLTSHLRLLRRLARPVEAGAGRTG